MTLSPFTAKESLQLLARAIGSDRVDAEPAATRHLTDLCGHLPLALRIAAEEVVADFPISDLIFDLQDVDRRLDGLQIPDDELYSVRGVLSWSYVRLDAAASHAFRELADDGIEGAAQRQTVERVTCWHVRTLSDAEHRTSKNWLPFPPHPDGRHEPVRLVDQNAIVAWCAREWENTAPLLRRAQRLGCHEQVWQLSYLLFSYFYAAGQAREWVETLRIGMRSAELVSNRRA